jgi:hypothetical protein
MHAYVVYVLCCLAVSIIWTELLMLLFSATYVLEVRARMVLELDSMPGIDLFGIKMEDM